MRALFVLLIIWPCLLFGQKMDAVSVAKRYHIVTKEREYKELITKADAALEQKKYDVALGLYEDAKAVNPSQSYPSSQIDKIMAIASQSPHGKWGSWEVLYTNSKVTVEIRFKVYNNGCSASSKKSKFKYKVTGSQYSLPNSLSWQLDYVDCYGRTKTDQFSLAKDMMRTSINTTEIRSMDYTFTCKYVKRKFHNVRKY